MCRKFPYWPNIEYSSYLYALVFMLLEFHTSPYLKVTCMHKNVLPPPTIYMIGSQYLSFSFTIIQELPFLHKSFCNHITVLHSRFCDVCHQYCAQCAYHVFSVSINQHFLLQICNSWRTKSRNWKGFRDALCLHGDKNNYLAVDTMLATLSLYLIITYLSKTEQNGEVWMCQTAG